MRKNRNKMYAWLMAAALSLAIAGCSNIKANTTSSKTVSESTTETVKETTSQSESTSETKVSGNYSAEDLDTSYSDSDTKIVLKNTDATITGDGASLKDGNVVITKAGTYVLSGEFNGSIITDVSDEAVVHIVLNGVSITNDTSAAINAATGKKVIITLVEGTENTLSDGSSYTYAAGEDEPDATLFVKNDLTINGEGSLTINSNYDTGIKAKDNLILISGNITVNSIQKAIKGSDSVTVENANIIINAEDDGITTDGAMVINGGSIKVEKSGEGLEAVTIDINGGDIEIISSDDGINARGVLDDAATDQEKEAYGMQNQADTYFRITGGVVNVNAQGDGIDSNGQVYIEGGELYISGSTSGGNGSMDYNGEAVITGGTFVCSGTQDMFQSFTNSSTQNYINAFYSNTIAAGTEIKVTDSNGDIIISYTPDKAFSSVIISSDKLITGESVTVTAGDNSQEITVTDGANQLGESSRGGGFGGDMGGGQGFPPSGGRPDGSNQNQGDRPEPPSGDGPNDRQGQNSEGRPQLPPSEGGFGEGGGRPEFPPSGDGNWGDRPGFPESNNSGYSN